MKAPEASWVLFRSASSSEASWVSFQPASSRRIGTCPRSTPPSSRRGPCRSSRNAAGLVDINVDQPARAGPLVARRGPAGHHQPRSMVHLGQARHHQPRSMVHLGQAVHTVTLKRTRPTVERARRRCKAMRRPPPAGRWCTAGRGPAADPGCGGNGRNTRPWPDQPGSAPPTGRPSSARPASTQPPDAQTSPLHHQTTTPLRRQRSISASHEGHLGLSRVKWLAGFPWI